MQSFSGRKCSVVSRSGRQGRFVFVQEMRTPLSNHPLEWRLLLAVGEPEVGPLPPSRRETYQLSHRRLGRLLGESRELTSRRQCPREPPQSASSLHRRSTCVFPNVEVR